MPDSFCPEPLARPPSDSGSQPGRVSRPAGGADALVAAAAHYSGRPGFSAGGTWLGLNRNGRWAAILNRRIEGAPLPGTAKTRGELIPQWLTCDMTAADFMAELRKQLADYQFFNLVVGEVGGDTVLLTSPERRVLQLKDGIYALSNCAFDADWEKTALLRQDLTALLDRRATGSDLCEQMVLLMRDEEQHPAISSEEDFSATRFILSAGYGTRCSTALVADRRPNGKLQVLERQWTQSGQPVPSAGGGFAFQPAG